MAKKKNKPIEGELIDEISPDEIIYDKWGEEHLIKDKQTGKIVLQEPKVTEVARLRALKSAEKMRKK